MTFPRIFRLLSARALGAAAATLLIAALTAIVTTPSAAAAPPAAAATITPTAITAMLGQAVNFTVTFDNASTTDTGYGPYLDVLLPIGGADGNDGMNFAGASYLGAAVTPLLVVTCTGAAVVHPLTGLSVPCPVGRQLVVLPLPFGSFTPSQPPASVSITANASNLADIGAALPISATPGFAYGASPTGTSPIIGASASATYTPEVFTFRKIYVGPEGETATGPNFPRTYQLVADIAPGVTVTNLDITDNLGATMQYLSSTVIAGGAATSVATPSTSTPGGTLARRFASVTGTASTADARVDLTFYVGAGSPTPILDPVSGDDRSDRNDGLASGRVVPVDPRDAATVVTINPNLVGTDDVVLEEKSIAVQKSAAVTTDVGSAGPSPDDIVTYTIQFQVSDYFTFGAVTVQDILGDGQFVDTTFTPTLSIAEGGVTTAGAFVFGTDYTRDTTQRTTCGNGSTNIGFNVSSALTRLGAANGTLTGGLVTGTNTGATTGVITFRARIDDAYLCTPRTGPIQPTDRVSNNVSINGEVYANATQAPQPIPQLEADTSSAGLIMVSEQMAKSIYARNGVVGGFTGSPAQYAPGDTITYRLQMPLPTSDIASLRIEDYLPLPALLATELTSFSATTCGVPAAGQACYGPNDTFHSLAGSPAPALSTDPVANSARFAYGNYDSTANPRTTVDLVFTVTLRGEPMRDDLLLTNQANASYINSFNETTTADAIVQIELTQPQLRIRKGVVDATNTSATYAGTRHPTGRTFSPVGSACPGFSPVPITTVNLAGAPDANVANIDAGDRVRFAIVVENTGEGLHGAYDVTIGDTIPAGFAIPASGLGLCVTDGTGTAYTYAATGFLAGSGTAPGTISLTDPGPLQGALRADNGLGTSGQNLAVITYELELVAAVEPGSAHLNTATINRYASGEGGPNYTAITPAADLTNTATATVRQPSVTKALVATNQTHTTGANVVIGESAQYQVVITVPEGTTSGAVLADALPAGLAMVSIDSIDPSSPDLTTSVAAGFAAVASGATVTAGGATFNFGTLINANRVNPTAETITIRYTVVVLDNAAMQAGVAARNSAVFRWAGGTLAAARATINVVEPDLVVTKVATPTNPDAGDVVTYTIQLRHTAASGATAFDVNLNDLIPAGLTYVAGSLQSVVGFTTPTALSDASSPTLTASWDTFGTASVAQLTYQARVDAGAAAPLTLINSVATTWKSLPSGTSVQSPYLTNTAEEKERDGGGGVDDYRRTTSAPISIANPSISKSFVASSEPSTAGQSLTIGEIATYDLAVTLPEGVITGFTVVDQLPVGMQYVAGSAQIFTTVAAAAGAIPPATLAADLGAAMPAPTITGGASSGDDLILTFGATTVTPDNNTVNNSFVVRLQARVLDVATNVGVAPQTQLVNGAQVQLAGGTGVAANTVTTPVVEPAMQLTKTVSPINAIQGDTITLTLRVRNAGLSTAFDVVIDDPLGVNYNEATAAPLATPAGWTYSLTGNIVSYTAGAGVGIAAGAEVVFTFTVDLDTPLPAGTAVPNTATVTAATTLPGADPGERNEPPVSGTGIVNVVAPDLVITKDDGTTTANPGDDRTYNLVVQNIGGADAYGVVITDTLPAATTLVSVGGDSRCVLQPPTGSGPLVIDIVPLVPGGPGIAAGATITCTVTVHMTNPAPAGTDAYTNNARVTEDGRNGADPTPDNNSDDDTDILSAPAPALWVEKDDGVTIVAPSQALSYVITVHNDGNIGVTNVYVADVLPAGIVYVGCSTVGVVVVACAEAGGVVTATFAGIAGGGATVSMTIDVTVVSPAPPTLTTLTNSVSVVDDGSNGVDDPADNTDTDIDTVDAAPDMAVRKTGSVVDSTTGALIDFTLEVSNGGNQDATGVVVTDVIPVGFTVDLVSITDGGVWDPLTRTISWGPPVNDVGGALDPFTAGQDHTFGYQVTVDDPALAGNHQFVNTAHVADDDTNGVDPTPVNNDDTWTVALVGFAPDLAIVKDDLDVSVAPGDAQTYTLTVSNVGNIGASGVTITDTLPAELDETTVTACAIQIPPASAVPVPCTVTGNVIDFALGTIPGGADDLPPEPGSTVIASYTVSVRNPAVTGARTIDNAASVTDDGTNGADPTPADNTDNDVDELVAEPLLDVEKDDGAVVRTIGDVFDYTITLANRGNQDATGVVITDTLPPGVVFVACTGGCISIGAPQIVWNVGNLAGGADMVPPNPGSSVSYTLTVLLAGPLPAGQEQFTNTVHATDDGANSAAPAEDTDTDTDDVIAVPDLSITKDDGVVTVTPGDELTYQIIVNNTGSQAATGVTVVDTLPANTTFVACSDSCDSSIPGQVTWTGVVDNPDLGTPGEFDAGGTKTLTVTVALATTVPTGITTITNTATVADDGTNGTDPTPTDNTDTDIDTVDAAPDMAITKTDGVTHVEAGDALTYTLTVTNNGNQDATGVAVADTLPANTTFQSCSDTCDSSALPAVTWPTFALAAGQTRTFTVTVQLADPLPTEVRLVTNTATVADDGVNGDDPTPQDNTDTDTDNRGVDLAVNKDDGATSAVPGTAVEYRIVVDQLGPSPITSFRLTESLPAALTNVTFEPSEGAFDPVTGLWSGIDFAEGDELVLVVRGTVSPEATGTLTNQVTVSPPVGFTDPLPDNNAAEDIDQLTPQATIALAKSLRGASLANSDDAFYDLVVTNAGPSLARDVVVVDHLPAALSYVASSGDGWTCTVSGQDVRCVFAATLAPGASSTVTLQVDVHGAVGETVHNTAGATASNHLGTVVSSTATALIEAPSSGPLAFTGANLLRLVATGLALVTAGSTLIALGPRRRRHSRCD